MLGCRPGRRLVSLYLLVQGVVGAAWWGLLLGVPGAQERFQPDGYPPGFITTYMLPDLALFVVASLVASWLILREGWEGMAALWCVAGATAYAALHCVGIAMATTGFAHAAVMMSAAAACVVTAALTIGPSPSMLPSFPFRESVSSRGRVARLVAQIVVFWGVLLLLLPLGLFWLERRLDLPALSSLDWWAPVRRAIGWSVFAAASVANLWVASVMLRVGRGTPLPSECASRLVTIGPYRAVRNPMAVAALVQGFGVAAILGSWLTVGYFGIGAVLWHCAVRPAEELDLQRRFGEDYDAYRAEVRCWIPRLSSGSSRRAH